ncbi:MAG: hypothetical protein ACOC04_06270 [Halothece sp.]
MISNFKLDRINWQTVVLFVLGFWLSGSLVLDGLILPGLSATGMMAQSDFASAGYLIFGIFNHLELLCAALVLTGMLVLYRHHSFTHTKQSWSILLSGILLAIAIIYTYILTPQMSGLGMQLNLFEAATVMPSRMISMHEEYWGLELVKFVAGVILLRWCYQESCSLKTGN